MEKKKAIYIIGTALLFLGLMAMMAPHFLIHTHPDGSTSKDHEHDFDHILHFTLPGLVPTLLGLYFVDRSNRKN